MSRFRARTWSLSILAVAALAIVVRGQTRDVSRMFIHSVGLPAIDQGVLSDETHTPAAAETARRAALQSSLLRDRIGRAGTRYVPGRILVKFRDGASAADRQAAIDSLPRSAAMTPRPSYAD